MKNLDKNYVYTFYYLSYKNSLDISRAISDGRTQVMLGCFSSIYENLIFALKEFWWFCYLNGYDSNCEIEANFLFKYNKSKNEMTWMAGFPFCLWHTQKKKVGIKSSSFTHPHGMSFFCCQICPHYTRLLNVYAKRIDTHIRHICDDKICIYFIRQGQDPRKI